MVEGQVAPLLPALYQLNAQTQGSLSQILFGWVWLRARAQTPVKGRIRVGMEAGELCSSITAPLEKLCYLQEIPYFFLMVKMS